MILGQGLEYWESQKRATGKGDHGHGHGLTWTCMPHALMRLPPR